MKGRNEQMGFDDLMMKYEGNGMKIKQPVEIVKHPNIKKGKTVSIKTERQWNERITTKQFKFKHKI